MTGIDNKRLTKSGEIKESDIEEEKNFRRF
jgi:hypothetical protein